MSTSKLVYPPPPAGIKGETQEVRRESAHFETLF